MIKISTDLVNKNILKKIPQGFFIVVTFNEDSNVYTGNGVVISRNGIFKLGVPNFEVIKDGVPSVYVSKFGNWHSTGGSKIDNGKFFLFGFIKKEFLGERIEVTEALYNYLSDKLQDMTFPLLHEYISTSTVKYDMLNFIEDFRKEIPEGVQILFHLYGYMDTGLNVILNKRDILYSKMNISLSGKFYHTKTGIQIDDSINFGRIYTESGKHIITKTDPAVWVGIPRGNNLLRYLGFDIILLSKIYYYLIHLNIDEIKQGIVKHIDILTVRKHLQGIPDDLKNLYKTEIDRQIVHLEKTIKDKKLEIKDYLTQNNDTLTE
jgi:hypothetical protein|nr:MAG TPA: hypothetical protein [Caudoviricetes sp.]